MTVYFISLKTFWVWKINDTSWSHCPLEHPHLFPWWKLFNIETFFFISVTVWPSAPFSRSLNSTGDRFHCMDLWKQNVKLVFDAIFMNEHLLTCGAGSVAFCGITGVLFMLIHKSYARILRYTQVDHLKSSEMTCLLNPTFSYEPLIWQKNTRNLRSEYVNVLVWGPICDFITVSLYQWILHVWSVPTCRLLAAVWTHSFSWSHKKLIVKKILQIH